MEEGESMVIRSLFLQVSVWQPESGTHLLPVETVLHSAGTSNHATHCADVSLVSQICALSNYCHEPCSCTCM